jgi:hypothetical protein
MKYWTYDEIKTKVEKDLDLEDESFITDTEMRGYANEAVDEAEAEIHGLYEDYFLSRETLSLVSGEEAYALPGAIYAHKIRKMIYKNGTRVVPITRIKDWRKFEAYALELTNSPNANTEYYWFLDNTTPTEPKIILAPTPAESGAFVTLWYIRNATRFEGDTDKCDIPEFVNFVMQFMKVRCYEKERNPNLGLAVAALEQQRKLMKETLASMVPDAENDIEPDFSSYEDQQG